MKNFLILLFLIFEYLCTIIGFVFVFQISIALFQEDACVSFKSPIFGDYRKPACDKNIKD